jgi:spermidine synthase
VTRVMKVVRARTVAVILALCAASPALADAQKLLHSERSLYREVMVYESGGRRCMCFTRNCRIGRQSCMEMRDPERIALNYPKLMLGSLYLQPRPRSILIIGLGGGTLPRVLVKALPDAAIDVVEIDPAVVSVAKRYFGFVTGERVRVIEMDGRVYVKRAIRERRQYDLIMLDAFDHEYIPEHLLTQEFLREVKTLLAPGAVLAANTFSSSRLYDHESVTYASVFGPFFNLKQENRVILLTHGPAPSSQQIAANSKVHENVLQPLGVDRARMLKLFSTKPDWNSRARVLTDQYSPANLLNLRE